MRGCVEQGLSQALEGECPRGPRQELGIGNEELGIVMGGERPREPSGMTSVPRARSRGEERFIKVLLSFLAIHFTLHSGKETPQWVQNMNPLNLIRVMVEQEAEGEAGPQRLPAVPAGQGRIVFQSSVGGAGFPVWFGNAPDTAVQSVIVATMASAADLATLIDAPETARIRVAQEGGALPGMTAAEESLTAQFRPDTWMVAEVDFESPVPLASLAFGDTAGRPQWERRWRGQIAEIVCLDAPPSADVRAGVANYLAARWGFRGPQYGATAAQRQAAIDAGLNYGVVWGTLIIVR